MERPKKEGIFKAEVAELRAAWQKVHGVLVVNGPYWDHTPTIETPITLKVRLEEGDYQGDKIFALIAENGHNLSAAPYEEFGWHDTPQAAIEAAVRLHGDDLNIAKEEWKTVEFSGGEDIDGTGRLHIVWNTPDTDADVWYLH